MRYWLVVSYGGRYHVGVEKPIKEALGEPESRGSFRGDLDSPGETQELLYTYDSPVKLGLSISTALTAYKRETPANFEFRAGRL
jgi:hypothetical protein